MCFPYWLHGPVLQCFLSARCTASVSCEVRLERLLLSSQFTELKLAELLPASGALPGNPIWSCAVKDEWKRPLSPRTRRKSDCCFFSLTSITIRARVTVGACWVMAALGVRCVCVLVCDRDCVNVSLGGTVQSEKRCWTWPELLWTHLGKRKS